MKNQGIKNKGKMIRMEEVMITDFPLEITINILSRLPVATILSCMYVCKRWRDSIKCLEFAECYLPKSAPCLAVSQKSVKKVFELADCLEPQTSISFNFKQRRRSVSLHSSVDSLLVLNDSRGRLYVCNPLSGEYIKLPLPSNISCPYMDTIGFGVSKITGKYKLVKTRVNTRKCEVYTLGTASWRSVAADTTIMYSPGLKGVFFNGNFYCLVFALKQNILWRVSCFDFETERFSTFSLPRLEWKSELLPSLTALGDRLCLCKILASGEETTSSIDIWSMKEYGDEKLWTKEFAIITEQLPQVIPFPFKAVKVFDDGDILMANDHGPELLRFSIKTDTVRRIDLPGLYADCRTTTVVYTPSFLPLLKTCFVREDVKSF